MWILISWLHYLQEKPADQDPYCLQELIYIWFHTVFERINCLSTVRYKLICSFGQVNFLWTSTFWLFICPWTSRKFYYFHRECMNLGFSGRTCHLLFFLQAFRLMMGPGHCPMISKYGPSLSKAVGPVDPSFLVVKKSHFKKDSSYSVSTSSSKQKVHVGCQYSKTCL